MPLPPDEPFDFAPAARFLQRRRSRARELVAFLGDATVIVVASGRPATMAGCLAAAGVDGLLRSTGLGVHQASGDRIARGTAAGDLLVVPPPTALGFDDADAAAMILARAPRSFDRVLLVGWSCPTPTTHLRELLGHERVMATVPDPASYAALKAHGRIELDLDPAVYFPGFGSALRDPAWEEAFDGASRTGRRGSRPFTVVGDAPRGSSSHDDLARLLVGIAESDSVITDRWHVVLSTLLLGRHVDYIDTPAGTMRSQLSFHFGGVAGALATPRDAAWVERLIGSKAQGR